ncbi:spermidine synthase [Crateriforma conspicua]|uniref:Spermidine synthase n=1 Tax=Crateriforma conspicua TaxID=2527996 RepID=A0A5C6FPT9_9PLAN|nr:fused MFS/spermidine synthase [Crateriforma conspicua]TWU65147.1 spermidine synthase [Crateriforma conspicua]
MTDAAAQPANPTRTDSHAAAATSPPIAWFALTILLSAFLVFQVQPVISKCVLPWFGGTPAVWTTCMLFFQIVLFAGYAYAHLLRCWFSPAVQGGIHLVFLAAATLFLPIQPDEIWKPQGDENPTIYLLMLLVAHVGLPYFVLSATGPLVQSWFSYRDRTDRVYRLYALSNVGSLSALLSYPFLIEPFVSLTGQSATWSMLFCGFVIAEGYLAIWLLRLSGLASQANASEDLAAKSEGPPENAFAQYALWLGLPAFASAGLLIVTNHVCQDIAVIPFLWVLPLSLYLLSFIICFDSPRWYRPKWIAAAALLCVILTQIHCVLPAGAKLVTEAVGYFGLLLGICLLCHGEATRSKPSAERLTTFYLCLSGGGAIGGVLVAVICPLAFRNYLELPLWLGVSTVVAFAFFVACTHWGSADSTVGQSLYQWAQLRRYRWGLAAAMLIPCLVGLTTTQDELLASRRNFFGVLKVTRDAGQTKLIHGRTVHGIQLSGDRRTCPTSYYGYESGVGRTIAAMQDRDREMRVGVVGLGCGVLATYGRPGDRFDYVEINQDVVDIADSHFSFLKDGAAQQQIHVGDGRLVLERLTDAKFDLLVLDAFSSDAIPAHLLTREAMGLYRDRLATDGVIAVHVSNNHLDLVPLVHRLAQSVNLESRLVESDRDAEAAVCRARWMILAAPQSPWWETGPLAECPPVSSQIRRRGPLWTDQHHNLASVLRLW